MIQVAKEIRKSAWFKSAAIGFLGIILVCHIYAYFFVMKTEAPHWLDLSFMGLVMGQVLIGLVLGGTAVMRRIWPLEEDERVDVQADD